MKKNSISNLIITAILDEYGGKSNFAYDDRFKNSFVYNHKYKLDSILTIDKRINKDTQLPYLEVNITDQRGKIIQRDCYEILCEGTELYKISSQKKGQKTIYLNEKIAYIGPSKKKTRKELENEIKTLKLENQGIKDQNMQLLKNSEQEFCNSKTYNLMKEKIEYLEASIKLNEIALENAEIKILKQKEDIQQIYNDNKKFIENINNEEYFIGITENWHEAWEYDKLKQEINTLKGRNNTYSIELLQKDNEIQELLKKIADSEKAEPKNSLLEQIEQNINETKIIKKPGRKSHMTEEIKDIIIKLHEKGYTIRDIARQTGYSTGWIHETIKRNTEQTKQ